MYCMLQLKSNYYLHNIHGTFSKTLGAKNVQLVSVHFSVFCIHVSAKQMANCLHGCSTLPCIHLELLVEIPGSYLQHDDSSMFLNTSLRKGTLDLLHLCLRVKLDVLQSAETLSI